MNVADGGPAGGVGGQHAVDEVGKLGRDGGPRNPQRLTVPYRDRRLVIRRHVEGRRRAGEILGVDQPESEEVDATPSWLGVTSASWMYPSNSGE